MTDARRIARTTFTTSRLLDFTSRKELEAQTGHPLDQWLFVIAKELADNGLDACEEARIAPVVTFVIDTKRGTMTVTDNGPGIPPATVASILDFNTRTSSREAYVAPTRGAQGNALKTLLAMPYVLAREFGDEGDAITIIEACGVKHTIGLTEDAVRQRPVISHNKQPSGRRTGTAITIPWPVSASSELRNEKTRFVQFASAFSMLNPHATIRVEWDGEASVWRASDPQWIKWWPDNPTPPCWYDRASFERLLSAEAHEDGSRTVRGFVSEFRGLARSNKVAEVLDATRLARTTVADLFKDGRPTRTIDKLLNAMRAVTNEVKPADLGIIGKDHFEAQFSRLGGKPTSFHYKRVLTTDDDGLPVVIEAAFAYAPGKRRELFVGVNFSAAINNPFRHLGADGEGLERVLAGQRCESTDPIIVAVHLTCPKINYLDRGKGGIALRGADSTSGETFEEDEDFLTPEVYARRDGTIAGEMIAAVKSVTARWLRQKKREEREHAARANRQAAMMRERREPQIVIAFEIMERAYLRVSDNGRLYANARQLMYACRDEIQQRSRKPLSDTYFTQTLVPNYIEKFKPRWADKIAYDDRGHLREPHTGREIGLGTINVRNYLARAGKPKLLEGFKVEVETRGPEHRFGGLLFVEKEGFDALFDQVQIAERYDVAVMSTKGMSVTAARELAETVCAQYDIPLFVLTDFDKAGFSGVGTFTKSNRRHTYTKKFEVFHIGLRLDDIRRLGVAGRAEDSFDNGKPEAIRANLKANGATEAEIRFLTTPLSGSTATGKRVELNALTSAELVELVERKLQQHGVAKVVPKNGDLTAAYRLFKRGAALREMIQSKSAEFDNVPVPADLEKRVRALLKENPAMPWDDAVAVVAGWSTR